MGLLEVENTIVSYGAVKALKGVNMKVAQGEIVALIGANGAGKSTLLKALSGMVKLVEGKISFNGVRIDGLRAHQPIKLGISHVPEGRQLFPKMTVEENLEMGAYAHNNRALLKENIANIFERFPILQERRNQVAGLLSGGQQQILAIGRALMSKPKLLLLDEPSFGLAPLVVKQIAEIIKELNAEGLTILLIEQNAQLALKLAHRAYVLETGQITLEGEGNALLNNDHVRRAYLGA